MYGRRVNGTLTTLAVLKSISDRLVDIHGQHEHQSLLNEKQHILMLDGFDPRIEPLKKQVAESYAVYTAAVKRRRSLMGSDGERERRIDILKFQIDEILKANIGENEEEELAARKVRLNAAERIMDALTVSYAALYEAEPLCALSALKNAGKSLNSLADVNPRYDELARRIDEAYYAAEEVASAIRSEMDEDFFDLATLESIEERLALIAGLKRKYADPSITGAYIKKAEQELSGLVSSEELLEELTKNETVLKADVYDKAVRLSALRREAAEAFTQQVNMQLEDLGMASARFTVCFADTGDIDSCVFSRTA